MGGKGRGIGLLAILSFLILSAVVANILFRTAASYYDHADKLSFYVRTNDQVGVQNELAQIHYFYDLSNKWHLQSFADKYLFKDAYFYQVADFYLIGNWEKITEDLLKDKLDDPRAYPYGNAKFREAQAQYKAGHTKEALEFVTTEVAGDFEKALRNCLETDVYMNCFDRVWNYDLATNKKAAEEALGGQKPQPKYILGPAKDKDGPPAPSPEKKDGKKAGAGKLGEEKIGPGQPNKRP